MSLDASKYLFFNNAKRASNDITSFSNLRLIKKQKPALFQKNITC